MDIYKDRSRIKYFFQGTLYLLVLFLMSGCFLNQPHSIGKNLAKSTDDPKLSEWKPQSPRLASQQEINHPVIPNNDHFFTLHGGVRSSDEVSIAFAPVFEAVWNSEGSAMVTESPVFDNKGDAYFIPFFPTEDGQNMLIKLDGETGARQWAVTRKAVQDSLLTFEGGETKTLAATLGQGGSPLILNDPDSKQNIIYAATYSRAYAVTENGKLLWVQDMRPLSFFKEQKIPEVTHIFGLTYQPAVDAIIVSGFNGDLVAFDRATGQRLGATLMPGSPAKGSGQQDQSSDANEEFSVLVRELFKSILGETFELTDFDLESSSALVDAVLGEGAINGNQISTDPNSNSIWVASTDLDEADGTKDGASELGALYRIDLLRQQDSLDFNFACKKSFMGGTSSTPSVSPDGLLVYSSDNNGSAIAIKRNCDLAWQLQVGETAVASLAVSSELGAEIYYPTRKSMYKIKENKQRNGAEVVWKANLNSSFYSGNILNSIEFLKTAVRRFLEKRLNIILPVSAIKFGAANLDLASIGQNGIMVHSGFGLIINLEGRERVLPIALNNALYDKRDGSFINGTRALEENIGAMYVAPDGSIIMGSSPVRRAILRAIVKAPDFVFQAGPVFEKIDDAFADFLVQPLIGGVTKYGAVKRFDLIARDSACGAHKRLTNTANYQKIYGDEEYKLGSRADKLDARQLIKQAKNALGTAQRAKEISLKQLYLARINLNQAQRAIKNDLPLAIKKLQDVCHVFGGN